MCFDDDFCKFAIGLNCFISKSRSILRTSTSSPSSPSTSAMRSMLVSIVFVITVTLSFLCNMSFAGLWVCKPCENQAACDADPVDYCIWGEVRDACNRRVCAKGPGERCGGSLNILGQCGEGMMCKSDERCHGCSIQTMQCHNE